jgi:hypothetical protein
MVKGVKDIGQLKLAVSPITRKIFLFKPEAPGIRGDPSN